MGRGSSDAASDTAQHFREAGYAVFCSALNEDALALLRGECDAFVAREDARMDALGTDRLDLSHRGKRYFANECQRSVPALRSVLFSPALADVCRATLGDDAYFFFDQFVVKYPEAGSAFSWHQDSGYVVGNGGPVDHPPYLTCWIPLDDATEANGTIRLVPGSHLDGLQPHDRRSSSNDLAAAVDDAGVIVEAQAGDVVAFSSLTLHATGANVSRARRRVYLAQYTREPMLDPGTPHLRRNAIAFLRGGAQVTFG